MFVLLSAMMISQEGMLGWRGENAQEDERAIGA
jgi:hypothetical protein